NEPGDRFAVELPHATVVQDRDIALGREEQISRMWVGIEQAMAVQRADVELVEGACRPFPHLGRWLRLKEGFEGCSLAPAGGRAPGAAPVRVDRRDGDRLMAGEQLDETRLTARLQRVVALFQEPSLRLFEDFGDIDARSKRSSHDFADDGC